MLLCLPVEVTFLRLVRLDIRANRISTLPVELRLMKTLIELFVDDNPLTSPPASVSNEASMACNACFAKKNRICSFMLYFCLR